MNITRHVGGSDGAEHETHGPLIRAPHSGEHRQALGDQDLTESPRILDKQLGEIGVPRRSFGLPYAIIRHYLLMQGHSEGAQTVASECKLYMSFMKGQLGMIDARHAVEVAARGTLSGYGKGFEHVF
jgi:hypothetical protein